MKVNLFPKSLIKLQAEISLFSFDLFLHLENLAPQINLIFQFNITGPRGGQVGWALAPSAPDRRARVRDLPSETSPNTLMVPGACKIRRGCNILQVPMQIIPLGVLRRWSHLLRDRSKLWRNVSLPAWPWPSLGMCLRPSAITNYVNIVRR